MGIQPDLISVPGATVELMTVFPDAIATDSGKLRGGLSYDLVAMKIGQKVKVFRLRDRVGNNIANKLGQIGTITDYKMTDGSGVGVTVKFEDNSSTWFFEDELKIVD
ncbi:DUF2862 domain-containing protein [Moorena sp. SIO4A5]|uniref:cytochrome b6f subunit PetP n=1 Tax=unclassified Moorena TaxID=2683338 RepID=UPI00342A42A0